MSKKPIENIEAEQGLLGGILARNELYWEVADNLKSEHFYEPLHQMIWETIVTLMGSGKSVSVITAKQHLPSDSKVGDLTLNQYMALLASEAVTQVKDLAGAVIDAYTRRIIQARCEDTIQLCESPTPDFDAQRILSNLNESLEPLQGIETKWGNEVRYNHILEYAYEHKRKELENQAERQVGWFLDEIEEAVGKSRPGNLIGLMSDSGGGKTSISLQQCRWAAERGYKTAFISLEVTAEEAAMQSVSQVLQVPMEKVDDLDLGERESAFVDELGNSLPLSIVSPPRQYGTADIHRKCVELKRRMGGLDLVIVDHAKLVKLPGKGNEIFAERVNNLYRELKIIAKNLNIVLIILIQRNDNWRKRATPWPMDGDAYGGTSIKQNLDNWFSLYRPDALRDWYEQQIEEAHTTEKKDKLQVDMENNKNTAWFVVHKRRRGAAGKSRKVKFKAETVTFEPWPTEIMF